MLRIKGQRLREIEATGGSEEKAHWAYRTYKAYGTNMDYGANRG